MTNLDTLPSGLEHKEVMLVEQRHTVPEVAPWPGFSDMPPVFATAMMIGFMEQTCIQALRPFLNKNQATVGTDVNVSHVAPTPINGTVTAKVTLQTIEKRKLSFSVSISDNKGLIGEGTHERVIIDVDRFEAGVIKRMEN